MSDVMSLQQRFAAELRSRRGFLDISQEELAERSGVNQKSISQYESELCMPSLANAVKLAGALGCTPNDLLGWK